MTYQALSRSDRLHVLIAPKCICRPCVADCCALSFEAHLRCFEAANAEFCVQCGVSWVRSVRFGNLMRVSRVVGGEDGAVKLLDVFHERPRRGSNTQAAADPASQAFHGPYAKVVQTLPSHESSVGAVAVGLYRRGGGVFKGLESTLVVSGGGKMEARAWCLEGGCGPGGDDAGGPREEVMQAACAPPVSYPLLGCGLWYPVSVMVVCRSCSG